MWCPDCLLDCPLLSCRYQAEKRAAQERYKAIGALLDEQCAANAEQHAEEAAQVGHSFVPALLTASQLAVQKPWPGHSGTTAWPEEAGHGEPSRQGICAGLWVGTGPSPVQFGRWPVSPRTQDAAGFVS